MIHVGIGYHQKYSQVEAMDKGGKTIARGRWANKEEVFSWVLGSGHRGL